MELREYWRVFKRRAWIPAVLVVVTVLTAGALTFLSKPEYVATATVQAKATGPSGSTATQTLSFQEVAASNKLALAVIKDLNLSQSAAELSKRIKVTAGHSDLYTVQITDPNPNTATSIADTVAKDAATLYQQENSTAGSTVFQDDTKGTQDALLKAYGDAETALLSFQKDNPRVASSGDVALLAQWHQLQLQDQAAATSYTTFLQNTTIATANALSQANNFTASVLDPAVAKPDTTGRYLRVAYAAALALLLGIGLIYLLEYMDNSVREPDGVEDMIGAPVIGIIPKATPHTLRPARGGAA